MTTIVGADRGADYTGTGLEHRRGAIACQANDWFIAFGKWEGANGSSATLSANQSTSQTGSTAVVDHSGNDLHGRGFYGQIDSGSSIILTLNLPGSRPYAGVHGDVFRPAGGQVLVSMF